MFMPMACLNGQRGSPRPDPAERRARVWRGLTVQAAAVVLFASALAPAWAADRALIIGIDDYRFDGLDLPPNSSSVDAQNLKTLAVERLGFSAENVKILINEQASRDAILSAVDDWLIAGTGPGDRVLFTYSGHGYYVADQDGDEEDGRDEVLVPWDTTRSSDGEIGNLLRDDTLRERFDLLSDRETLVLVDSCHSGTVTRAVAGADTEEASSYMRNAAALRGFGTMSGGTMSGLGTRSGDDVLDPDAHANSFVPMETARAARVFSAAAASEVAWVDPHATPQQGVFTRSLIEAVGEGRADANGNGIISNAEVLSYLRTASQRFCEGNPQCSSLTPTLETSESLIGHDFRTGEKAPSTATGVTDGLGKPTADISLAIEPSARVRLGETVVFVARSSIDGYLILLDINADGAVTQLFPNRFTGEDNAVRQGQTVRIPDERYGFDFRAIEPVGRGHLVAIIASEKVTPEGLLAANRDLATIADPQPYLDQMADSLVGAWSRQSSGRPLVWGYVQTPYEIEP